MLCEIIHATETNSWQVGLGQLHYQGGRGVDMDHAVSFSIFIYI